MVVTQRHKTAAGTESSRRQTATVQHGRKSTTAKAQVRGLTAKDATSRRQTVREPPNEYCDLKDGIRQLWMSWTATTNTGDLWRRIEQSGIENALKKLSQTKADLSIISTLSSEDAINLTAVMVEFAELLNCIRLAFVDNEQEILDKDEHEKRFISTTCPQILEMWTSFSSFASQFAANIAQKCWHNSAEERELLRMTVEVAAASVKLLVLSIDVAGYHNSVEVDNLIPVVEKETAVACRDLQEFVKKVANLGDSHSTYDSMVEMVGWKLYGINHLCSKVIRPVIEAKDPDRSFEENDDLHIAIERTLKDLKPILGENEKEPEATPEPEPLQKKTSGKKHVKTPKAVKTDYKDSKGVKTEQEVLNEETKSPKESCLVILQKVADAYTKYSEQAWEKQLLPVLHGASGVKVKYRMECYDQIGRVSVKPCSMVHRKSLLDKLSLTDDYTISSEIFVFEPEGLTCSNEVIVEMPLISLPPQENGQLILKVKADGKWSDVKVFEKVMIDDVPGISFSTQSCEAFVCVVFVPPTEFVVGPTGGNYISVDVGKVEIHVPPDCYDHETTLKIKTIPFDTSSYPSLFIGVVAASVAIEVSPADSYDDSYTDMKKYMTVQLPIKDEEEDKDTEVVAVRYNGESCHVLDKKQITLKTIDTSLFTVDVKGYWCIGVLRIRKVFLNMRDTIKKEFLAGYNRKLPCKLLTFIDHVTRANERQTFVMEAVEKCNVDTTVESKREFGLVEIKKGRSKDILLKTGEVIHMQIDGQMRHTEVLSDQHQDLCFIRGLSNVIHAATEVKRDPEKLPDAMLIYRRKPDDIVVHSVAMMTRDLSELPTEEITARTETNVHMLAGKRINEDESSVHILKMESLMSLARELTFDEGSQLGRQLGVKQEKILQIKEKADRDLIGANFQILCHWRGRFSRATMADFLVSSLKAVGKPNYADIITEVRRHNRGLEKKDFQKKTKQEM